MCASDDASDETTDDLDQRERFPTGVRKVAMQLGKIMSSNELTPDELECGRWMVEVLLFGARHNETILLPRPWAVGDVLGVIGASEAPEPGSDAAWRQARRQYDAAHPNYGLRSGRGEEGRTR